MPTTRNADVERSDADDDDSGHRPGAARDLRGVIVEAKTVVFNGPMGVYE